ncbi:hypothetical protein ABI59_03540 [Acidobacteria bacterium Mor1]|nr:hypothetical protein ABI59_03540 [Acidobacteria bacterium Mor1]
MIRPGRRLPLVALALTGLLCAGCGYALQGTKIEGIPDYISAIAVDPFENRTQQPEIEQRVTEQVAAELAKRSRFKLVSAKEDANALLTGVVTEFRTNPVQFTDEGRASRVEAVVTIQATLRDLTNDEILWSQPGLLFREQFDVSDEEQEFFDQTGQALDDIGRGAALALITSIFEGF